MPDEHRTHVRSLAEIQRAHDVLWAFLNRPTLRGTMPHAGRQMAAQQLVAMCWALGHAGGKGLEDALRALEARAAELGCPVAKGQVPA